MTECGISVGHTSSGSIEIARAENSTETHDEDTLPANRHILQVKDK